MLRKLSKLVWNLLGAPYYIVKKVIELFITGSKMVGIAMSGVIQIIFKSIMSMVDMIIKAIKKVLNVIMSFVKLIINAFSWGFKQLFRFIKYTPTILKAVGKWLIDAIKESIAQIFTLLGFFIAWLTLTGSAKDIVGIAIIISTAIWLLTMGIREE